LICSGVAHVEITDVLPRGLFEIRHDEAKNSLGFQNPPGVIQRKVKVIQCQMLKDVAGVDTGANGIGDREPPHNVSVTHIGRKSRLILGV
jgi:hypothetical protein